MPRNARTEADLGRAAAATIGGDGSHRHPRRHGAMVAVAALLAGLLVALAPIPAAATYVTVNLVSDLPGVAPVTDPHLVNPWGLTRSPTSPWWAADNGTGVATLYNGAGQPFPVGAPLVVTIPPPNGGAPPSAPTGTVFNGNAGSFGGARFIFSTEDGTIAAWSAGTSAVLKIDNSAAGSIYKGLAIGNGGGQDRLFATDFHNGRVDVFTTGGVPGTFAQITVPGGFTDPNLPAGYAPFGIQNIGGKLFVTFALLGPGGKDETAGPGLGIVDEFDTNGNLLHRIASGGTLDAPWGLALAPANFGEFSNDLLVGNFGDGAISAFDLSNLSFVGQLDNPDGSLLHIDGLWALEFGGGNANSGKTNELFFTAGINDESDGLFGFIAVPEPASAILLLSALGLFGLGRRRPLHP